MADWSRDRRSCGWIAVAALLLAAGCARPVQRVVAIPLPSAVQPASGRSVAIVEVVDSRRFVHESADPGEPQLITGGHDDPAVTARAFGQFTTAGGDRFWDFLLPERQSVAELVRASLVRGFRIAGFVVVEPGENVSGAIPVTAEVLRFWTWNTGSWTFAFHFVADVVVRAAIPPFEGGRSVQGAMRLRSAMGAGDHSYVNTTTKGLDDFGENLRQALVAGSVSAPEP